MATFDSGMDSARASTTFVGRTDEIAIVHRLLYEARLLTIMGPAGSGKTRLAYEAANRLRTRFPGGLFVCELAPLADTDRLPASLASSFGVEIDPGVHLTQIVAQQLGNEPALLVLDNCEHLRAAVSVLIQHLLAAVPSLSVLATSRERLRVPGEMAWPIPALSLPNDSRSFESSEAVALLIERIRARDPLYSPSLEARLILAQVCRRLEGLPLAIELAASRLAVIPPRALLEMLDDALATLRGGEGVARQETLERSLDWSYDLLDGPQRTTFRRLSVFAGTFGLPAAAAVLGTTEAQALERLAELHDRSLVVSDVHGELASFRMLEPIRQYADQQLRSQRDETDARRSHAGWVVAQVAELSSQVLGRGQLAAARAFRQLLPDVRLGFRWSLKNAPDLVAALGAATGYLWDLTGHLKEGNSVLQAALAANPTEKQKARIYTMLTLLAARRGDEECLRYAELGVEHARSAGIEVELGHALFHLGFALGALNLEGSQDAFDEAAEIAARTKNRLLGAWVAATRTLGLVARGEFVDARRAYESQIPVVLEMGDIHSATIASFNLARICITQGDNAAARRALRGGLRLLDQHQNWAVSAPLLMSASILAARAGRLHESASLAAAYSRLCEIFERGRVIPLSEARVLQDRLPRDEYEAATAKGARLQITEMFELARREAEHVDRADYGNLTSRELEVVRLVARGLSNKEVAARIRRSERTVESHVQHALAKLGKSSRTELGAWAQREGLLGP